MNTKTGEILEFDKAEMARREGFTPLTSAEHDKYKNIPQEDRPREWALSEHLEKYSFGPNSGMELFRLKQAFRAGFDAGRNKQMNEVDKLVCAELGTLHATIEARDAEVARWKEKAQLN